MIDYFTYRQPVEACFFFFHFTIWRTIYFLRKRKQTWQFIDQKCKWMRNQNRWLQLISVWIYDFETWKSLKNAYKNRSLIMFNLNSKFICNHFIFLEFLFSIQHLKQFSFQNILFQKTKMFESWVYPWEIRLRRKKNIITFFHDKSKLN